MTPEQEREWKEKQRIKKRQTSMEWNKAHPEKAREHQKRYCDKKIEERRKKARDWAKKDREVNPGKYRERNKTWRDKNTEKSKANRLLNVEIFRKKERDYARDYRKKNPIKSRNRDKQQRLSKIQRNPERVRLAAIASRRRATQNITKAYVAGLLGISAGELSQFLLEAKRAQIKTTRILKTIKQQINEETTD